MAKKKALTGEQIFKMWMKEAQNGLSRSKTRKFSQDIYDNHTPLAAAHIDDLLSGDPATGRPALQFGEPEKKATNQVAKDLGKICRMLTKGSKVVSEDIFDRVRKLVSRSHAVCRSGASGAGDWCGY